MSRAYALVDFDPPQLAAGYGGATWFRLFRCRACHTTMGRQRIGRTYGPDAGGSGIGATGYTIERVELVREMVELPPVDGLPSFGLPRRAFRERLSPRGTERRSAVRRVTLVLPSMEGVDQLGITQRGDPVHVSRHDPRRARGGESGAWMLALGRAQALEPCVVTCPNLACRRRWLVAGLPRETEFA